MRQSSTLRRGLECPRVIATLVFLALALIGCSNGNAASAVHGGDGYEKLELRYEGSPGMVTYVELAEDLGFLAPIKLNYVGNSIGGPQSMQACVTGDTDFGGAFNGAVLKLFLAKAPIQAVVGYYGSDKETFIGFYTLENSPIREARDLLGKKVAVNTLGAHGEFAVNEYLLRHGLSREDARQVTLVVVPPINGEQALRQRQVEVTMLHGVLRDKALERGGIRLLFSDYDLFGAFTAGAVVMTKRFLRDNPKTARKFVEATAKAISWAQHTPRDEVVARFEKIASRRGRGEDTSIFKYWRSTGIAQEGGVLAASDFQRWIDWLAREGEIPEGRIELHDLYRNDMNPFSTGRQE